MAKVILNGSVLAAAALVKYFFFTKRPVSRALRNSQPLPGLGCSGLLFRPSPNRAT
jgi:hypothetical protein